MIKFTILLIRNLSLTHAEFVAHHKEVHAALFLAACQFVVSRENVVKA